MSSAPRLVVYAGHSEDERDSQLEARRVAELDPSTLGGWSRLPRAASPPRESAFDEAGDEGVHCQDPGRPGGARAAALCQAMVCDLPVVAVRKALEAEIQALMNGKKKADQAVEDAQKKADELMRPYAETTSLKSLVSVIAERSEGSHAGCKRR